jgi:TonB-dependent receptor
MRKLQNSITLILFCFVSLGSFAQGSGTISGVILDGANDNEPMAFANVVTVGSNLGSTTDFDGKYTITAAAGTYDLIFSFIGYNVDTVKGVQITAGQTTTVNHTLNQGSVSLAAVDVVTKANKESEATLLLERKEASGIVSNIGAQKLKETGSSDVAAGLGRVAGISVVGGQNVFVRGMGDRYNSAYLNGMPIASPDPDLKVIPLNIFRTVIVKNLNVQKAFEAPLYGDFAGGAINITTKDYPSEPLLQVRFGAGINTQRNGGDFFTYQGGNSDYWGFDDGTREYPDEVRELDFYDSRVDGQEDAFPNLFDKQTITTPINTAFGITGGNYYKNKDGEGGFGFLVSVDHKNEASYQPGIYRIVNRQDDFQIDYDVQSWRRETNTSALANAAYEIDRNNKISYNFLYVNLSSDDFRETGDKTGFHFDYQREIFTRRYTWRQNGLIVNQIYGEHEVGRWNLRWDASFNRATSTDPDRRQFVYLKNNSSYLINTQDFNENHRFYSELEENEFNGRLMGTYALRMDEDGESTWDLTLGADMKRKQRDFDYWQINIDFNEYVASDSPDADPDNMESIINQENFDNGKIAYREIAGLASAYQANLNINSFYVATSGKMGPRSEGMIGLRMEDGTQTLDYRDQVQPAIPKTETLDQIAFMPTASYKYDLNENSSLRASASRTISRPAYREVGPFQYIEFFAGRQSIGNPELQNGANYNADLRFETYPQPGNLVAVTLFGKYLDSPIERVLIATASGQLESFINTESAIVAGVEFEYVQNLGKWFGEDSQWRNFGLNFNASAMYTDVTINRDATVGGSSVISTNDQRPLQGASPYLVNADLTYTKRFGKDDQLKSTATLSYNVFGPRIFSAGAQGIGDVYERPVNMLNFSWRNKVSDHWSVNFYARNILNPEILQKQESNNPQNPNGEAVIVNSYQRGVDFSISLTYDVF